MFTIFRSKETGYNGVQDSNPSNVDNINKVRHEAIRHFRNKKEGTSES